MAKSKNINIHKQVCYIGTARKTVELCYQTKEPIIIWGNPGIGKSQMVYQLSKELKIEFLDVRLAQLGPEDVRGLPMPVDVKSNDIETGDDKSEKELRWIVPNFWPRNKDWKGIIFLDEMNQGSPGVLNAMFQLILDRRLGDYILPKGAYVVAACNDRSVNRYVTELSSPLMNRFTHIEMEVNTDEWLTWAIDNNIHPAVYGYIKSNPSKLSDFDIMQDSKSFPTPRTWEKVSKYLHFVDSVGNKKEYDHVLSIAISGAIGYSYASDFEVYRKITVKLPSPTDILQGKVKKLPSDSIDAIDTMTTHLIYTLKEMHALKEAGKITAEAWGDITSNYLEFIDTYPHVELRFFAFKTAMESNNLSIYSKHSIFTKYCKEFSGKINSLEI